MTHRGDGFLIWLGTTAVGLALYAPLVGVPSTLREFGLLVAVPLAFGTVVSCLRGIGNRL
jgi:hypothetical protein